MSDLREKIKTRGYWTVVIRPVEFVQSRVQDVMDLRRILEKAVVRLRGWDFPHLGQEEDDEIGADWLGQETEWEHHLEAWRLYQSGQFWHLSGICEDWRDQSGWLPASEGWQHGQRLPVLDTVYRLTEVFEFAARLALTKAGGDAMHVEASLKKLSGRRLWMEDPMRGPMAGRKTRLPGLVYEKEYTRQALVAGPRELAVEASRFVFCRFGWDANLEVLRGMQEQLRG